MNVAPLEYDELMKIAAAEKEKIQANPADPDTEPDTDAEPAGSGPRGRGAPMRTGSHHRERDFRDGAGLCSPGRWPPWSRPSPRGPRLLRLRAAIRRAVRELGNKVGGGVDQIYEQLAAGQCTEPPFPTAVIDDLAEYALALFDDEARGGARVQDGDLPQPVRIRLLQAILREAGDPDASGMTHFAKGIWLGVGKKLPRTPAVFERKVKWRLTEQAQLHAYEPCVASHWRENYKTAVMHEAAIAEQLEAQVAKGHAIKLTPTEAKRRFPRLQVASLGAVVKTKPHAAAAGESHGAVAIRIVQDGTHGVEINKKIRVRDQDRCPVAGDVRRQQREQARTRPGTGLAVDFSEAHHIPRVRPQDWHLQGCRAQPGGDVYIFTVGVFGVASISHWWARLGGAAVRSAIYMADPSMEIWAMLMADDLKLESTSPEQPSDLLFVLMYLAILGFPLAWPKVHGGAELRWIGYHVLVSRLRLGVTEHRAAWACSWARRLVRDGLTDMDDFRSGLCRLSFIAGVLDYERPFLAPLFTFAALHHGGGMRELPLFVISVLDHLAERFEKRRHYPSAERRVREAEAFRVDAMAEGNTIGIGGWRPCRGDDGCIDRALSSWFAVTLDEASAPWAFERGAPYRSIAALEAMGALLAIIAFAPQGQENSDSTLMMTGVTDNLGNQFILSRLMTTKFPLCVVLMEAAAQLEARGMRLCLNWTPREGNSEADQLSNGITDGFTPGRRVHIDVRKIPWLVLDRLMAQGCAFERAKNNLRDKPQSARRKRGKRDRLRDTDPW